MFKLKLSLLMLVTLSVQPFATSWFFSGAEKNIGALDELGETKTANNVRALVAEVGGETTGEAEQKPGMSKFKKFCYGLGGTAAACGGVFAYNLWQAAQKA